MTETDTFWSKLANDILDAADQVATRMEEGIATLISGETQPKGSRASSSEDFGGDDMEDFGGSPLEGIADSVIGDIMSNQPQPESPMERIDAFRHAITWSEPFILSLIAFHIFMFAMTIWVSRKDRGITTRLVVMFTIAAIVRLAETLNGYGAIHWESFATQNYFDKQGFFFMVMICTPLLIDSLLLLIFFLREASQLLIQVKRAELKKKRKDKTDSKTKKKNE